MKELVLQNFNTCTIKSLLTNKEEFFHRLIVGYQPLWRLGVNSGELAGSKNDAVYPLFPSNKINSVSFGSYGHIISSAAPISQTTTGDIYVITSAGRVLGLNMSGVVTDYGYFTGSAISSNNVDIAVFNGKIVCVDGGYAYYKNEDNTGSWTTFGSSISGGRIIEVFANWLYVGDIDSNGVRRYIRIFNTAFTEQTPQFNLGVGTAIIDFRSIDDQYMAIIGQSVAYKGENKVYIWDGMPGTSFIKAIPLIGQYVGMAKIGSSWFIISHQYNTLYIYAFSGLSLTLKKVIRGIRPLFTQTIRRSTLTSLDSFLVCPVDVDTTYYLLFYDIINDETFLNKVGSSSDFAYGIAHAAGQTSDEYLILFSSIDGTMTYMRGGTIVNEYPSAWFSSSYAGYYQSNWITLGRITINKIEVYYDNKPDANGSISLTLDTKDEYLRTDFATTTIGSVTSSDSKYRKEFLVGKSCSQFRINLTITHGGTDNWSGAVKKIIIYYTAENAIQ